MGWNPWQGQLKASILLAERADSPTGIARNRTSRLNIRHLDEAGSNGGSAQPSAWPAGASGTNRHWRFEREEKTLGSPHVQAVVAKILTQPVTARAAAQVAEGLGQPMIRGNDSNG